MKRLIVVMHLLFFSVLLAENVELSGTVVDNESQESLIGANIVLKPTNQGTTSDSSGHFILAASPGRYTLTVTFMGYKPLKKEVILQNQNRTIECHLEPLVLRGEQVAVVAERETPEVAAFQLQPAEIRSMTSPLPDVMQTLKTLPGVSSTSDQTSFYNVRGGSYDENLLYINGFELSQLHIVRKGYHENPSLVHPYLIEDIELRTGGFPVTYGDKLSSVLDIRYKTELEKAFSGVVDVRTTGVTAAVHSRINSRWNMHLGYRKINYGFILGSLQAQGDYRPDFQDLQFFTTYQPSSELQFEVLGIVANSEFRSEPETWINRDYRTGVYRLHYDKGSREQFSFQSYLLGLKAIYKTESTTWSWTNSLFRQREKEETHLFGTLFFQPHYYAEETPTTHYVDQTVDSDFFGDYVHSKFQVDKRSSAVITWTTGAEAKVFKLDHSQYQFSSSTTPDSIVIADPTQNQSNADQWSGGIAAAFAQVQFRPQSDMLLHVGGRAVYAHLSNEVIALPRFLFRYDLNDQSSIVATAGQYAQPPIYREFAGADDKAKLKSQVVSNFTIGYEGRPRRNVNLKVEAFYKLYDNLISYTIENVQLFYSGENDATGLAYGVDAYMHWKPSKRMSNWISYSYLVARQDLHGDDLGYFPMPSDRRHQIAFYTEESMERWENSKIHIRLLYGSGYPYTLYSFRINEQTGDRLVYQTRPNGARMQFYTRFDIGFTQEFKIGKYKLQLRQEILNLFNHFNVIGYSKTPWNQLLKHSLSGRTYNLGAQIEF